MSHSFGHGFPDQGTLVPDNWQFDLTPRTQICEKLISHNAIPETRLYAHNGSNSMVTNPWSTGYTTIFGSRKLTYHAIWEIFFVKSQKTPPARGTLQLGLSNKAGKEIWIDNKGRTRYEMGTIIQANYSPLDNKHLPIRITYDPDRNRITFHKGQRKVQSLRITNQDTEQGFFPFVRLDWQWGMVTLTSAWRKPKNLIEHAAMAVISTRDKHSSWEKYNLPFTLIKLLEKIETDKERFYPAKVTNKMRQRGDILDMLISQRSQGRPNRKDLYQSISGQKLETLINRSETILRNLHRQGWQANDKQEWDAASQQIAVRDVVDHTWGY